MGAVTAAEVVETGERHNRLGHRILPRVERARLIAAFRASGLTMAAFARREAINYATLAGWMSKVERAPTPARKPIAFAQVQLPGPVATAPDDEMMEVRLPDGTVLLTSTARMPVTSAKPRASCGSDAGRMPDANLTTQSRNGRRRRIWSCD